MNNTSNMDCKNNGNDSSLLTQNPKDIREVTLGLNGISVEEFVAIARFNAELKFSDAFISRINKCRGTIEQFLEENRLIYGVTTGFGENVRYVVSPKDANTLQKNIIRSHACSVGQPLIKEQVRAIQMMMILNTGAGHSGISIEMISMIKNLLNHQITPYAPGEGSVGYLAVEGHLTLVTIGEGKAWYKDELLQGSEALKRAGLIPVNVGCKEGLSLLNGSTSVTALGLLAIYDAINTAKAIDIISAASYEALRGTIKGCDERLHSVKKHVEQQRTARLIRTILKDSQIMELHKDDKVQDAYILRCTPHFHGAAKRILRQSFESISEEMNSVSDNPIIYEDGDEEIALMGGNFDGSYVGSAADYTCIALGILAKISERRIDRMVNRFFSGLPAFLVKNPGLNNGFMIPQYTAAGLVGEIKAMAYPCSVDSIPTCANQEDPVSLAYFASKKAYDSVKKLQYIAAIELMTSMQALDFVTEEADMATITKKIYDFVRESVPTVEEDRFYGDDMDYLFKIIREGDLVKLVESEIGTLEF